MKHDSVLPVQADVISLQNFEFVYQDETFLLSAHDKFALTSSQYKQVYIQRDQAVQEALAENTKSA